MPEIHDNGGIRNRSYSGLSRVVDVLVAAFALITCLPIIAVAAICLFTASRGPIVFRQERIGRGGRRFTFYKLRTMQVSGGSSITTDRDVRIFPLGRYLRTTKIDELPSLWNVIKGDMSLVGPRPEVPEFVDIADPLWQQVLREKPGITHPITLKLRNESRLLAAMEEPESYYRNTLLPFKLDGYREYAHSRTLRTDLAVFGQTLYVLLFGGDQKT